MKRVKTGFWILGLGFWMLGLDGFAQADEAQVLLDNVARNFDKLDHFQVTALIKVDVDFIRIKDREVRISYKKPDVFTIESDGLALLPKNGMQMEYLNLIGKGYTSIISGQEDVEGVRTTIVKVIPEAELEDIVLAQMWIDPVASRIVRMKTYTKTSGSYVIDFKFRDHPFNLPEQTIVTFDVSAMTIPAKMLSEFAAQGEKVKETPSAAKVIVQYTNYRVNQ